jgi:hypothetical protein
MPMGYKKHIKELSDRADYLESENYGNECSLVTDVVEILRANEGRGDTAVLHLILERLSRLPY